MEIADKTVEQMQASISALLSVCNELKDTVSLLVDNSEEQLSLPEFCRRLGIDRRTLRKYYELYKLPISYPYDVNGRRPKFTVKDLVVVKKFLQRRR